MITGPLKSQVDKLWTEFWTGGITNPLTVIEQISFLAFARLLDMRESVDEKKHNRVNPDKPFKGLFKKSEQRLRWSSFKNLGGEEMLKVVRDEVFPHFRQLGKEGGPFGDFMKDATLMIQKPSLLVSAVEMIDQLPLGTGDTKGDLYEYLLSKLTTAGINGQFRTPRHIIRMMVELVEPQPTWTIGDPACGTGGFLVGVMDYLRQRYTSPEAIIRTKNEEGKETVTYTGDLLEPYRRHIQNKMFHGFDFDVTMLRISSMNLMLHGVNSPAIHYQDTLSNSFPDRFPNLASGGFDLVLANPPFKGSLDDQDVHSALTGKVKTKKTELLFLVLMLRMLKPGGRCAAIVPDGVLFGSSKAHIELRKLLINENQLDGVVKLPAGVFKPYAGVSTAVLLFTKGGKTGDVFFYDVQSDGFSLDDKRDKIGNDSDFQDVSRVPEVWSKWVSGKHLTHFANREAKAFYVSRQEIVEQNFDLSLSRYKKVVHENVEYDPPNVIITRLKKLEAEIAKDMEELEALLG
jgi:type I restriction enzyme M protein